MIKKFIYLLTLSLLLISSTSVLAQSLGFTFALGGASVKMNDMKYLQEHILDTYPVEGKITSSFPPFTSASISVFKQLYDHIRIGGAYSYSTTGGKSSYADYSGNISTEINATSHRLGAYISYLVSGGNRLDLLLKGSLDANYTSLSIQSSYNIYSYQSGINNYYRSISPAITVGTELMYQFNKFSLGIEAGYLVDLAGDLKNRDSGEALLDPNDFERTLSSDWTGWYVQIKGMIPLKF